MRTVPVAGIGQSNMRATPTTFTTATSIISTAITSMNVVLKAERATRPPVRLRTHARGMRRDTRMGADVATRRFRTAITTTIWSADICITRTGNIAMTTAM